ncbi:hypothetical protein [Nocardioides jejuensis]|uniref:Uncharacterized protein n=1 Tax=Nocardioides jejuensis TaxID=2502782 RepID=A0A4R1BUH8_9ACTN|nr:hypothetical protein [Nocardioides jejuensis]TCJ21583.1 hypothetical protein EPD65_14700 [Nocardioides jejuensis]
MRKNSGRTAWRWTFPLIAAVQSASVLAFFGYLLILDGPTRNRSVLYFETDVLPLAPFLWLGLSLVGLAAVLRWPSGWARTAAEIGTGLAGAFGVVGAAVLGLAWMLVSSYGADFDFPAAPPTPGFATTVAKADGSDDDDPMRGREVVIDAGTHTEAEVLAFYRTHFPHSSGWADGSAEEDGRTDFSLCRVRTDNSDYDEYVEVYGRGGGQFLVSVSRLFANSDWGPRRADRCGLAGIWFPSQI